MIEDAYEAIESPSVFYILLGGFRHMLRYVALTLYASVVPTPFFPFFYRRYVSHSHYRGRWLPLRGREAPGFIWLTFSPRGHVRVELYGGHMSSISGVDAKIEERQQMLPFRRLALVVNTCPRHTIRRRYLPELDIRTIHVHAARDDAIIVAMMP